MENAYLKESKHRYTLYKALRMKIKIEKGENFCVLQIPKLKRKNDYIRLCKKMKKFGVQTVCIDDIKDEVLRYYIKQEFSVKDGSKLFMDYFYDILSFFINKKEMNLPESQIVLISNNSRMTEEYISFIYKKVKRISIYTTTPSLFFSLTEKYRDEYGIFLELMGKDDKVKKYRRFYINIDKENSFKDDFFRGCYLLDPFCKYKGGFYDVIFQFKTSDEHLIQKYNIRKNLMFTDFFRENNNNFNRKDNKIVNIEKI